MEFHARSFLDTRRMERTLPLTVPTIRRVRPRSVSARSSQKAQVHLEPRRSGLPSGCGTSPDGLLLHLLIRQWHIDRRVQLSSTGLFGPTQFGAQSSSSRLSVTRYREVCCPFHRLNSHILRPVRLPNPKCSARILHQMSSRHPSARRPNRFFWAMPSWHRWKELLPGKSHQIMPARPRAVWRRFMRT